MDRDSVAVRALRTICAEYKNNPGYASERDIVVHRLAREALEFLDEMERKNGI